MKTKPSDLETAKGHVQKRADDGINNTFEEKIVMKWLIETNLDTHNFLMFLIEKELGVKVYLSRTTVVYELLKKYQTPDRVKDVVVRWHQQFRSQETVQE